MSPRIRALAIASFGWFVTCTLLAQNTNLPTFGIRVIPTNGSVFASESTNAVFVTITNWMDVTNVFTNITVRGTFGAQTNIVFHDDGRVPDTLGTNGTYSGYLITPYVTEVTNQTLELVIRGVEIVGDPPPDPLPEPQLVTNTVEYIIVPRPWNDRFTNAFKIPPEGGLIYATNDYASMQAREPKHADDPVVDESVWWFWSTPIATRVLFDLGGSSFDAVLAVYTGDSISNLVEVAASTNDIVNHLKANVSFIAQAGTTYRVAVSGYDSSTNSVGDIRLRIALGAFPDTNGPVVSIVSPAGETIVTSELVAFDGTAKERNSNESGVSKVYLQVNTLTNLVLASGTTDWSAVVKLPVGANLVTAYAVDYDGNRGPKTGIVIQYVNPANDLFANATELTDVGGLVTVDNTYATKEPGEPNHAGNDGGHSVWFKWRAPRSGDLYLSTETSSFDTVMGLYIGNTVANLIPLASNDDASQGSGYSAILWKVVAGQVYYIAVDGFGGAKGALTLSYSLNTAGDLYSLSILPPLGGTVLPANASGLYEPGSTVVLSAVADKRFVFTGWADASGAVVYGDATYILTMNQNYTLEAKFRVRDYTDTFKTGDFSALPWSTAGIAPWSVVVADGQYRARSGPISNGQYSLLSLTTNMYAGTVAFDVSVSSELGFDWLEFYLNGTLKNRWSGEVAWQTYMFTVPQGVNTLQWRYVKDANGSGGLDAAFIDNIYLPLDKPNPIGTKPLLSLLRLSNGSMQLTLQVQPSVPYVIQSTANLTNWVSVWTNTPSGSSFQWIDADSLTQTKRFYRALSSP